VALPQNRDEQKLLRVMGAETANVHLGDDSTKTAIQKDLPQRHGHWLRKAAEAMTDAIAEEWKQGRKGRNAGTVAPPPLPPRPAGNDRGGDCRPGPPSAAGSAGGGTR
jgi:hypothetical protein